MLTVEELVRSCQTAAAEPEPVAAVMVLLERLVSRPSELLAGWIRLLAASVTSTPRPS